MDHNENTNPEITPGEAEEITEQIPAETVSAAEETADNTYRGMGVGMKETLYTEPRYDDPGAPVKSNPEQEFTPPPAPEPIPEKPRKTKGKAGRRILAAVLSLVILAGACGITAFSVNSRWEKRTARMEADFIVHVENLQKQINDASATANQALSTSSGISVSGSPLASNGSMTPAQVYAANVNSVVAISNFVNVSGRNGNDSLQLVGTGSGFILSQDGYVVTNYHVVEGASALSVTTHIGEEYTATLVGYDDINDVALLKVEAAGLDAVELGSSSDLIVGDMVVAIGNPLGELTATQTVGYISGKDRAVSTDGTVINMLQTDAAINSGNSGGPLFNMKGQVIGITTAKYSGASSSGATIEGIGFAIPIDDITGMIDDFKDYGYLRNQAYLGVNVIDMDSSTASIYSLPVGSWVQSVVEGSSAEKAGVQPQDIIIGVGGYPVTGNNSLTTALRKFSAGDTTTITVFRAGQELELSITFDERPQDVNADNNDTVAPGEMPSSGSFDEWYDYFFRGFGGNGNG